MSNERFFALTSGERIEYDVKEGWNLELRYQETGEVSALYRFVKFGEHMDVIQPDGPLKAEVSKYSAFKIACNLREACFVVNPHDIPGAAWQQHFCYTLPELEFHAERSGYGLPPNTEELLTAMRDSRGAVQEHGRVISEGRSLIIDPVLETAGIPKLFSWSLNTDFVKGHEVQRAHFPMEDPTPVVAAFEQMFPNSVNYTNRRESWQDPGESREIWVVKDPDKLLEMQTGLSHSAIAVDKYNRKFPHANVIVSVARLHPTAEIFRGLNRLADYVKEPGRPYQKSVEEAVAGFYSSH